MKGNGLKLDGMHGRSEKQQVYVMRAGPCSTYPSRLEEDGLDFDILGLVKLSLYTRLPLSDMVDEMQMGRGSKKRRRRNAEQNH